MVTKKFYITTTIPYANAPPHIGFALEIIQTDVLARWHKLLGEEVFFLTGTDEHGVKNYQTAKKQGLTTQEFVDKNSAEFRKLTKVLNISNNYFIRTTDKKVHWPGVIKIWKSLFKKGDIYKKKYFGNYCSGCERFITDKELINGRCPDHPNLKIEKISEENYFFKLSKYSSKIIQLIKTNKLKISPKKWKNDFISLIKDGLTDVSFSREKKHLPWGIPVPGNENQTMYVWPDALTNYLTGVGFPNKKFEKYWPADIHVVGKDMLRFHTGIWPGMLLSAGLSLPKEVIVHGFLTVNGQKMSKSLENVISPIYLSGKYEADSIRYTLMRSIPFGDDGDFSEKVLVNQHNTELANKLGNLVSRIQGLVIRNEGSLKKGVCDKKLYSKLNLKKIKELMQNYELDKVIGEIFAFIDSCNEFIQEKKPWELGGKEFKDVIYTSADSIRIIAILLWPFIPKTSEKIAKAFNFKIKSGSIGDCKPGLLKSCKIKKQEILFKKIKQ
jgi:methionyl-tRNA synthetase